MSDDNDVDDNYNLYKLICFLLFGKMLNPDEGTDSESPWQGHLDDDGENNDDDDDADDVDFFDNDDGDDTILHKVSWCAGQSYLDQKVSHANPSLQKS